MTNLLDYLPLTGTYREYAGGSDDEMTSGSTNRSWDEWDGESDVYRCTECGFEPVFDADDTCPGCGDIF